MKYLTFDLDGEFYGVPILKIQEIIGLLPISRVPKMPAFFRGVLNLRGTILPVIDLRLRFAFDATEDTKRTCVIVVRPQEDSNQTVGLVVDSVAEVKDIDPAQIESSISRPSDEAPIRR